MTLLLPTCLTGSRCVLPELRDHDLGEQDPRAVSGRPLQPTPTGMLYLALDHVSWNSNLRWKVWPYSELCDYSKSLFLLAISQVFYPLNSELVGTCVFTRFSVIGGLFIIAGLYLVTWARYNEAQSALVAGYLRPLLLPTTKAEGSSFRGLH